MFLNVLQTLNQLITAGISITAFSLLLHVLTFNLRNRVARSFAVILACVTVVFTGEALSSVLTAPDELEFWLKLQWLGIIFLPAGYLHASDALLAVTGRPSRGRRRLLVRVAYLVSLLFLFLLPANLLVNGLSTGVGPAPHLLPTSLTWVFAAYYAALIVWAGVNFWRAYKRTSTSTSRRRILYLMAGATAPALGSFPYLIFGYGLADRLPWLFWLVAFGSNLLVTVLLVLMAYAVAFFGVAWPDRVVKSRLFKWIMRGPVTASTVLAVTTLTRRIGIAYGWDYTAVAPVLMVATILIFQLGITLLAPLWERWLFFGSDQQDLRTFQDLENRLLTTGDLRQYLEAILAAVCDRLQAPLAFITALREGQLEMAVTAGDRHLLQEHSLSEEMLKVVAENDHHKGQFSWGPYWLIPLYEPESPADRELHPPRRSRPAPRRLFGLMGVLRPAEQILDDEQAEALEVLSSRAAHALQDWQVQRQVLVTLRDLTPQVELIQQLRAASRYDGSTILADADVPLEQAKLSRWTKEALSHYWGGPKLTESPLLKLQVVQKVIEAGENPANALRLVLKQAVEQVRPQGERRFTGEWILYNILDMKFMEGRKVREVAMRLAMSEADFYRKQRIAIEEVARVIVDMERDLLVESSSSAHLETQPHTQEV